MTILQAIILGLIQGLTEFLPVSSSGHLLFVPAIFGWSDQGVAFDVVVHLGSLLAVLWYFRGRIGRVVGSFVDHDNPVTAADRKLGYMVALATIPALIAGLIIEKILDLDIRSTMLVGINLIVWGIVLAVADKYAAKKPGEKGIEAHTRKSALLVGCAQALALLPGTSRSGITMTAGLFGNFSRAAVAEFSFLMSVPIILIAGGLALLDLITDGAGGIGIAPLIAGFIAAAGSGYVAIRLLMKLIEKWSFVPFAVYRVVVGVLILLFLV